MEEKESIWNRKLEEIVRGYCEGEDTFTCVLCGEQFEKGRIYQSRGEYFDALGMVKAHVCQNHGSVVEYLLSRESGFLGVSEAQKGILKMMAEGKDDRAIAQEAGIAQSTVRNHRFKLREKQKQAKMFLALMEALETQTSRKIGQSDQGELAEVPQTARQVDERYVVTDADREKTIKTYMDKSGRSGSFHPKRRKS